MSMAQALSKDQLAAMVSSADAKNPVIVAVVAYLVKNCVDGNLGHLSLVHVDDFGR